MRVHTKEMEKIGKYQDLARELKKLRNMKLLVIPGMIGTLRITPKNISNRLDGIRIEIRILEL